MLVLDRGDELTEQVRRSLVDLPRPVDVVVCTKIGSLQHVLEHDGGFDVLVAGPSLATRAGFKRLVALRKAAPLLPIVIAFGERPQASLREIIQVGAVDLIELPADDTTIRNAVRRALEAARSETIDLEPAGSAPRGLGKVITISSPTGGCGKTFYATNVAWLLATEAKARVAIVDLDLQFGEIATTLRVKAPHTIYDLVQRQDEETNDFTACVQDHLVQYRDLFWILNAPKEPTQADGVTADDITRVIDNLRRRFDYVIVDTPAALTEGVLAAMDLTDHLFVLSTIDLPAVRNLGVFLRTLEQLRVSPDIVSIVMNKIETDVGVDVRQVAKLFPQGFRSELPYAKEVSRSINGGRTVLEAYPSAAVSRLLREGVSEFLPQRSSDGDDLSVVRGSMIGRFLRRAKVGAGA